MSPDLWSRLAAVFLAAGVSLILSLLCGIVVVPLCRRFGFVSRESKEGVAEGRTDRVCMGGGFILLLGVTLTVLAFTAGRQIRVGYAACLLIAIWGFGLLGFLDDRSKVVQRGYSDRLKVVLQVSVAMLFAISFHLYVGRFVREPGAAPLTARLSMSDLGVVTLPFAGHLSLGWGYVPFVMLFLFWVSNAVNITDGFNGLAGGTGAVVALAYTVVTFLIGAYEQKTLGDTGIGRRMFALSLMSAALAGSCLSYLYFNYFRGCIYFGDTGSMALGAALAFLALFSRTEFLLCIIGGVFFVEALSVFLQRSWVALTNLFADDLMRQRMEPSRPFVIAPLHHHFEHLLMRERELPGRDPGDDRVDVRRRITTWAWGYSAAFALIGITAQYGLYRSWRWLYDWACVVGVLFGLGLLGIGVLTRFLYDCYFIGPDLTDGSRLTLYRGVPLRCGKWRLFHIYEETTIPVTRLGYFEQRTGLLRLLFSRVDARTWFGLLHFQCADRTSGDERLEHLRCALRFWEEVPWRRFLVAAREDVLLHMAVCYEAVGRYAQAVEVAEKLLRATNRPEVLARIESLQRQALAQAESAYADWASDRSADDARQSAYEAHLELTQLLKLRAGRATQVRAAMDGRLADGSAEQLALDGEIALLQDALAVAEARCRRLAPEGDRSA